MISAIVAVDNNWGIGFNGDLLEHIPEDLEYFKSLTTEGIVIMGRKTWDSLPKKPLPNRLNVVITHRDDMELKDNVIFCDLEAAKQLALKASENFATNHIGAFIIGGGNIYEKLLPICDKVYVTKIFIDHDQVDTYFPNLDKMTEWRFAKCSNIHQYKNLTYQFWEYDRI